MENRHIFELAVGLTVMAAGFALGALETEYSNRRYHPISASVQDVNQDGLEDVVLMNRKDDTYNSVLIQRPDGTYDKTTVKLDAGIPFYCNGKGCYTPNGSFLPR